MQHLMSSEKATTRSGRAVCYSARDAFYQCLRECGLLEVKGDIPSKCKQLRAKFESACLPSWVSFEGYGGCSAHHLQALEQYCTLAALVWSTLHIDQGCSAALQ